jgi:peptide/nickel transport system ATP-binding protein
MPPCSAHARGSCESARGPNVDWRREIIAQGATADIFAPPFHPYTEKLLAAVPEMDTTWLDQVLATRVAA